MYPISSPAVSVIFSYFTLLLYFFQSITKKLTEDPQLLHKVAEKVHAVGMQSSRSETNGVAAPSGRKGNNIFF